MEIDLSIAMKKLYELQLNDGDLGARYWYEISELLKEAPSYKARALAAEEKLRQIQEHGN